MRPITRTKSRKSHKKPAKVIVHSKFGVRVAHVKHTGRKLGVHYTSYAVVFFLLVLLGATLLFLGQIVRAAQQQAQGDISLSGTSNGPPPSTAAVITSPVTGTHFSQNIIEVKGTCTADLLVEIYRYAIFAGSVYCTSSGTFDLNITLIPGANDLKARIRDGAGQYGPDSNIVTVFYDVPKQTVPPTPGAPLRTARPFLIYTDPVQRGVANGQILKIKYEINGGKAPYAISVSWGDSSRNDVSSYDNEGDFFATHQYTQGGQYTISISGGDAANNKAFIQSTAVMQGPTRATGSLSACDDPIVAASNHCAISTLLQQFISSVWPAFIVASLMTVSFWLGERVIYQRLERSPKRTYSTQN